MADAKHTPGPWVTPISSDWMVDTDGENSFQFVGPKGGSPVAAVIVPAAYGLDHILEANANLLSAAPDLLDALKAAYERLEYAKKIAGVDFPATMEMIEKTIAKAEGKS